MGIIRKPHKVKLFIGMLSKDMEHMRRASTRLKRVFGRIDFESDLLDFEHTDYYAAEMGHGLKRKFISFERLMNLDGIYMIKIATNRIEKALSRDGKRAVNIDPGYLDMSKVVLFSTKDYSHRIYLGKGIFAEVTLYYKDGTFNAWPWTYPDYKTTAYISIFNSVRELYKSGI
ncbi:MAG: DUF4416 family protein [Candidatus Omnitrophica bacterium]|nr:DUF4416 family protein [Candidatus Omnitrophota bacterium]MCM8790271.1 DUF4416 family protein [Candidatus Omnitrophota bacterium]